MEQNNMNSFDLVWFSISTAYNLSDRIPEDILMANLKKR